MENNLDLLRGHALNCAVAEALGWEQDKKHKRWWNDKEGHSWNIPFDDDPSVRISRLFDPAHRIEDAWTLGSEGGWDSEETSTVIAVWISAPYHVHIVKLLFADFPTRNEARATAHTIAWLKAQ